MRPTGRNNLKQKPLGAEFAIAGLSGIGTALITNPADVLKTRLQLQGELAARETYQRVYKNTFHAAYTIARNEGILALQSGLAPVLCYQVMVNAIRIGSYHFAKRTGITTNEAGDTNVIKTATLSAFTGGLAVIIGSPLYMAKVKLQSREAHASSIGKTLNTRIILKSAWQEGGFKALYRGWYANVPRVAIGSAIQFPLFGLVTDCLKTIDYFKDKPILLTFLASIFGGSIMVFLVHPLDVMSTRIYNQGTNHGKGQLYNGMCDTLIKIFRTEGLPGLYKGLVPHWLRIAPYVIASQTLYEKISMIYEDIISRERITNDLLS